MVHVLPVKLSRKAKEFLEKAVRDYAPHVKIYVQAKEQDNFY
jgi:hypothetical protein